MKNFESTPKSNKNEIKVSPNKKISNNNTYSPKQLEINNQMSELEFLELQKKLENTKLEEEIVEEQNWGLKFNITHH